MPAISAALPKGTEKIPAARKYDVAIHPRKIVSIPNSLPIGGRAMFTEELMKGARKAGIAATIKAVVLFRVRPTTAILSGLNLIKCR